MTVFRKAAVYLGLVDDDDGAYQVDEDYLAGEGYDEDATREAPALGARLRAPTAAPERVESSGAVTVVRGPRSVDPSKPTIVAAAVARPASADTPTVRAMPAPATRVHVLDPDSFNDAQEVGDRLKAGQPVILNLQVVDRELQRRLIDFASGLCYALNGTMSKAADQVFLLTPANVDVPDDEMERLSARGLYSAR